MHTISIMYLPKYRSAGLDEELCRALWRKTIHRYAVKRAIVAGSVAIVSGCCNEAERIAGQRTDTAKCGAAHEQRHVISISRRHRVNQRQKISCGQDSGGGCGYAR